MSTVIYLCLEIILESLITSLIRTHLSVFCLIQASSPLQVKYADGELERLGIYNFSKLIAYILLPMRLSELILIHYLVMFLLLNL